MKNKPSPQQLIDYLYGESSPDSTAQMDALMKESPELATELAQMKQLRASMQALSDISAPSPPILLPQPEEVEKQNRFPRFLTNPFSRKIATLAACLSFIMIIGAVTNPEITVNQQGFSLRFGKSASQRGSDSQKLALALNSLRNLQQEVRSSQGKQSSQQTDQLIQEVAALKGALAQFNQLAISGKQSPSGISSASSSGKALSDAQLKQLLLILSSENNRLMKETLQAVNEQQERQLQEALENFAYHLDDIRKEDIQAVLAGLEELNRRSESKSKETDRALEAIYQSLQARSN